MKKEEMCFLKLQDMTGTLEVLVFPRVYEAARSYLLTDQIVVISGKLEEGELTPVLIAESVKSIHQVEESQIEEPKGKNLEVAIPKDADRTLLSKIYQILKSSPGDNQTFLVLPGANGNPKKFQVPFGAQKTSKLAQELEMLGCRILT